MRVVIQRVKSAKVHIKDYPTAEIGQGLLVLLGVGTDDSKEDIDWLVKKIVALRIFDDDEGVMNRSVQDVGGDIMVVSQSISSLLSSVPTPNSTNNPCPISAVG